VASFALACVLLMHLASASCWPIEHALCSNKVEFHRSKEKHAFLLFFFSYIATSSYKFIKENEKSFTYFA